MFNNRFDEKIKLSLNELKRDFRTKMINSLMSLLIGCSFAILFSDRDDYIDEDIIF